MLEHGGKLRDAAQQYNIPLADWVDLSTGINPNGWQLNEAIATDTWNRLPEENDGLLLAAQKYYGCDSLLPIAGSQAAIQVLPSLFKQSNVGIVNLTYAEHAHAWKKHGHTIIAVTSENIEEKISDIDILVIVNPNNPTGDIFSQQTLHLWHQILAKKNGHLIIDEAFMDCTPQYSMLTKQAKSNLIILRSIGKFFGLAGIRVGFVAAPQIILTALNESLGPWALSGPSRFYAKHALNDTQWQINNRKYLASESQRLIRILTDHQLTPNGSTSLFCWIKTEKAKQLHQQLSHEGIFTRLFLPTKQTTSSIRFGLPKNETQWTKLTQALDKTT